MGIKNIYERFVWFDDRVRSKKYPNAIIHRITNVLNKHAIIGDQIEDAVSFQLIEYTPTSEFENSRKAVEV